jgi:hypothetical protein
MLLSCLEDVIAYINRYAYCYVAAYGYDFITAGTTVMQMFTRKSEIAQQSSSGGGTRGLGWHAVINDNLIFNALWVFGFIWDFEWIIDYRRFIKHGGCVYHSSR